MDLYDQSLALYEQGRAALEAQEFDDALALFEHSASLHPHFKTYELMGEILYDRGDHAKAVMPLAAATALNKGVRAPALLARAFLALDDFDQAKDAAEEALRRQPANRTAREVLDSIALRRPE